MRTIYIALLAGQRIEFNIVGEYFGLMETTTPIDIEFLKQGAVQYDAQNVEFGYYAKPKGGFTGLAFTSAAAQTIKIHYGLGEGGYNRLTGVVQIIGNQGAFADGAATVTNANQAIIAANASRKYLMIQNNDPVAVLRVRLSGVAATATRGFRIQPGNSQELNGYQSTAAINVMMETASAVADNVEYVTG